MGSDPSFLLIGALATQANTTKDTIRHYDEMGLLNSRKRQAGSRLCTEFHPECIERIKLIKSAQATGFTLTEIKDSLNDYYDGQLDIDLQLNITKQKLAQIQEQQANINVMVDLLSERIEILESIKVLEPTKAGNYSKLDIETCRRKYLQNNDSLSD